MFEKLTKKAMDLLLTGDDYVLKNLRKQYENAIISTIENTNVGLLVSFEIPKSIEKINFKTIKRDFVFGDVFGTVDKVFGAVGFIIFIKDGYLKTLEIYSIGSDIWEQVTDDLDIRYNTEPRDLEVLAMSWHTALKR
jgi:hypothetical protein